MKRTTIVLVALLLAALGLMQIDWTTAQPPPLGRFPWEEGSGRLPWETDDNPQLQPPRPAPGQPWPASNLGPPWPPSNSVGPHAIDQHDRRVAEIVAKYRQTEDDRERQLLRDQLTEVVTKQFAERQQRRTAELQKLESQVKRLREIHQRREQEKDRIITDRVEQVVRDADGIGWGTERPGAFGIPTSSGEHIPTPSTAQPLLPAIPGPLPDLPPTPPSSLPEANKQHRARNTIHAIEAAIELYRFSMKSYPAELNDLFNAPPRYENSEASWTGPYINATEIPRDPWGNSYKYVSPGKHNPSTYDLWSTGPDGKDGTDDDIGNWATTTANAPGTVEKTTQAVAANVGDAAKIQGLWRAISVTDHSREAGEIKWCAITADKIIFVQSIDKDGPGDTETMRYKLDPTKSPKWIDLADERGRGRISRGIYELEGDRLKIGMGDFGSDQKRSTAVESKPNSENEVLIVLERKSALAEPEASQH